MSDVRVVLDCGNSLGEGPIWDHRDGCLYWVDIDSRLIHRLRPEAGEHTSWEVPGRPSALGLRQHHPRSLIVAAEHGVGFVDLESGDWQDYVRLEDPVERPENRTNDGKIDPLGRFWVGTMHADVKGRTGALYCIQRDAAVSWDLTGLGIPNTFAWTDGTMYFGDSLDRVVRAFPMVGDEVLFHDPRVLFELPPGDACPDGSTIDVDGCLWTCIWDGGRIEQRGPDGSLLRTVEVPVQRPTSCAFGGPNLDVLYVTSARRGLAKPNGALLAIDGCGRGRPEGLFEG